MNNAQTYLNKPVVQGTSHHSHHSHQSISNGNEDKKNHENIPRQSNLNHVLAQNQDKPKDQNFIKQVSEVFNQDKKLGENKPNPINLNQQNQNQNSHLSQERLAHHDPLPYTGSQNINNPSSHTKDQTQTTSHRDLEEDQLRKRHSHHNPVSYSGLHSESLSNSQSYMGHSSGASSHRGGHHHDLRRKPRRIFLETESTVETEVQERDSYIFKDCETHSHYVSCRFSPEIHQFFFGVNIESCE